MYQCISSLGPSLRISLRSFSSGFRLQTNFNRAGPPPLPREQQREFEELQKAAQMPAANLNADGAPQMHPDARAPLKAEFEGDTNPKTGEQGGPKREPVGKWSEEGDWSFKGRVTDF